MKVEILEGIVRTDKVEAGWVGPGAQIDLSEADALVLIKSGDAKPVAEPKKPETKKSEGGKP